MKKKSMLSALNSSSRRTRVEVFCDETKVETLGEGYIIGYHYVDADEFNEVGHVEVIVAYDEDGDVAASYPNQFQVIPETEDDNFKYLRNECTRVLVQVWDLPSCARTKEDMIGYGYVMHISRVDGDTVYLVVAMQDGRLRETDSEHVIVVQVAG